MVTITLESVLARSRTIASQMATDANASPVIDNKAGERALLNSCILEIYRRKSSDVRFLRDIAVRHTIAMTAGVGTVPDNILREFLIMGDFEDVTGSLITYYNFATDFSSGNNFNQLGYVFIQGSSFLYTPPAPGTSTSYTANLFVTTPSTPTIGANIDFPSTATIDDTCLLLARALRGEIKFDLIDAVIA